MTKYAPCVGETFERWSYYPQYFAMMFASYFSPEFTESFDNAVENLNKIIKFDVFKILNVARFFKFFLFLKNP